VYAGADPVNRVDPGGRSNVLEYTGLMLKGAKGALGADVIGCSVSLAALIMNIVLGESPETLGTSLTAAGCGLTFVEAAVENPFGVRTLSVVVTGRLGKVIGATTCAAGVLDVIDKAKKYAAGPPNDDKLYGILFNTFDTTFGCTLWVAGMFGLLE
jgi:hypothetical protein